MTEEYLNNLINDVLENLIRQGYKKGNFLEQHEQLLQNFKNFDDFCDVHNDLKTPADFYNTSNRILITIKHYYGVREAFYVYSMYTTENDIKKAMEELVEYRGFIGLDVNKHIEEYTKNGRTEIINEHNTGDWDDYNEEIIVIEEWDKVLELKKLKLEYITKLNMLKEE